MQGTHPNPRFSSAIRDLLLDSVKNEHYFNDDCVGDKCCDKIPVDCVGDKCCDRIPDDEFGCWSYGFGVYKWLVKDQSRANGKCFTFLGHSGDGGSACFWEKTTGITFAGTNNNNLNGRNIKQLLFQNASKLVSCMVD